ncbi:MAG: glycine cleavage system protein H [bacterium]
MSSSEHCPDDLLYHSDHGWARVEGDVATLGITWYAQDQLGEVVFVDGAKVGDEVTMGEAYIELESVKTVSEAIAPLSGKIVAISEVAVREPDIVNRSPYGEGWLVRVSIANPAEKANLLTAGAYGELIG